jgi:hypothetical protein|tara:strand:- start:231 stop:509 length:279 start_codon:yes stop_codon:yes gene_type:complete
MATQKFTPKEINTAISELPKATREKIPKATKSQDMASLLGFLNRTVGSKTSLVIMEMLLGATPVMKKGGKVKRKPAGKTKIAKVMKKRRNKK